jgi:L-ascorbate metabolism protein UlaG (beta-lactamase superfamily)
MGLSPADIPWNPMGTRPTDEQSALGVRWLGTAGYELSYQGTVVLIDPYFSRVPISQLWFKKAQIKHQVIERFVTDAHAILVGHSHFDHVMDVPAIAQMTGAKVFGSLSTANLCRAGGVPDQQVVTLPTDGLEFEVGPFRITAVPSEHSRFLFGRIPYAGDVPCSCELPMPGKAYRCGQVFSFLVTVGGRQIYHVGSANLIDDAFQAKDVDLLLMCIAGRNFTNKYVERLIRQVKPQRIIPMHYDNFFRGFDAEMKLLPLTRLGQLVNEIGGVSTEIEVQTMDIEQKVLLGV